MPGVGLDAYLSSHAHPVFLLLTAVARTDLSGWGFRDGYAPVEAFAGRLQPHPCDWPSLNRARVPLLLQPAGLCSAKGPAGCYNRSGVVVASRRTADGLPLLRQWLHWIASRQSEQRARSLPDFWRAYLHGEPPRLLFHAQGAQFAVSREAVRRRPWSLYRSLLDDVTGHVDPVASYYLELLWWYVFRP